MGKSVMASLLLLSCVLFSAFALVPPTDSFASGQETPAPATIPVAPDTSKTPLVGTVDFSPSVLNLNSGGKYVTMRLVLPEGVSVSSVYIPSLRFMGSVYAETCFSDHDTGADKENSPHVVLKFLRADVQAVLSPGEQVQIYLTGMLCDGTPLYASGVVTITG